MFFQVNIKFKNKEILNLQIPHRYTVEEKSVISFPAFSFPSLKDFFICALGIKSSTGCAVPSKEVAGDSKTL